MKTDKFRRAAITVISSHDNQVRDFKRFIVKTYIFLSSKIIYIKWKLRISATELGIPLEKQFSRTRAQ